MKNISNYVLILMSLLLTANHYLYGHTNSLVIIQSNLNDHTAANEKLAKEIQKAIDGLNELKDADKIETLKKIKKHIEDNKTIEPGQNLDNARRQVVKKGERLDWLDNLIRGWKASLGILEDAPGGGWKSVEGNSRISRILLEPIIYEAGPDIAPHTHAYFTYEMLPGSDIQFLNARFTDPSTGTSRWLVENLPLLPVSEAQIMSYTINVEAFGPAYNFLQCAYQVDTTYSNASDFLPIGNVDLTPQPTIYNVASGSPDQPLDVGTEISFGIGALLPKGKIEFRLRDDMPNVDLDASKNPSDNMACGPAAAANSLQWLVKQHKELAGDTTSLRSKVDSLKKYMNRGDAIGVRFDSMVVGKLTIIDKLKLPINVKYKTKHDSGNVKDPLASTEKPNHKADNKGKSGAHPDFDWLKKEINDGEDVEVHVGWYGPPDKKGKRVRHGGHWLVGTGYADLGGKKKVYLKDDDDQAKAKGQRHKDYTWDTLSNGQPYLKELKDSKGNIAIVESVVSESFDPTMTFDDNVSMTIPYPWSLITLTDVSMKPYYPAIIPVESNFPVVPVIIGATGIGVLTYFLLKDDDQSDDCIFSATAQSTSSSCELANGSITVTISPESSYTYQWTNGSISKDLQNIAAGVYTVTITRTGTSCTQVLSSIVTNVNEPIVTTISTQDADCGMQNGTATVTVSPPDTYTFNWSNESNAQNQTQLAPGAYTLTVTSVGTCNNVSSITIAELPVDIQLTTQSTPSACGSSEGTATATASPPGEYVYSWSNGQSGTQATNLEAGTYSVTATIVGTNCSSSAEITVDELPPSFTITTTTTSTNCGVEDGTASVTVDPPGSYTYQWSNGETTAQLSNLGAGTYSVTVSISGTTCTQESSVTIDELPPSFTVTISSTPSGCGLSDGTATVIVDPTGTYTYAWSNGGTTEQQTGLAAGTYSVTVSIPGSSCTQETSFTIDELPPSFTVSISSTPSGCGLSDGTATVIVDPMGTYTYVWTNGGTTEQQTGLPAGTYSVSVSVPGSSCIQEASVTIDELPAPFELTSETTPTACGMSEGTATVSVTPDGAYDFQWSNGGTGAMQSDLAAGSYTVTVSISGSTCSKTITVDVEELPAGFTVTTTSTPAGCGVSDGTATVVVDPPGVYEYIWSNGVTDPEITNVPSGEYNVTVSVPGTMCLVVSTVIVEQTGGGFTATFVTTDADCGLTNGGATIVVDPPAEYTYAWSNQQSGSELSEVGAGTYTVTVSDINGCAEEFSVTIGETPVEYITITSMTPGNCLGNGEVSFTLSTPGTGPMAVQIDGPSGSVSTSLTPGAYQLSALMTVTSGVYTFTVYDEGIGNICTQVITATVQDNTPSLVATDDFYSTPGGVPVSENALDNDSGLSIQMTGVMNEFGGEVTFSASGDFTFTPDPGFSGDASFTYTITDVCGNTSTAIVTIFVEETICEFEVDFETSSASCGLEDGSITAVVLASGSFDYEWSNGESGQTINDVGAGTYTVTIYDLDLGCNLVFSVDLPENPAGYISDVVITQPACGLPGEIMFTAFTGTQNPLVMSVSHPNGSDLFFIDPGVIVLSDFISITPGSYTIEVFDAGAGPDCFESFDAVLIAAPALVIQAGPILPPSSPSAMDGVIAIEVVTPGQFPYTVYLNGIPIFTTTENVFFIEGVGVGEYSVQIIDAQGCTSNVLIVVVPFPDIMISFGTSIVYSRPDASNEQPVGVDQQHIWRSALRGSLRYYIGKIDQEIRLLYAPSLANRNGTYYPGFLEAEYMMEAGNYIWKNVILSLQGGLGMHATTAPHYGSEATSMSNYWLLRANAGYTLARKVRLEGSVSLRGWDRIELPVLEFSVSVPFVVGRSFSLPQIK